jgi:hypothetical protein
MALRLGTLQIGYKENQRLNKMTIKQTLTALASGLVLLAGCSKPEYKITNQVLTVYNGTNSEGNVTIRQIDEISTDKNREQWYTKHELICYIDSLGTNKTWLVLKGNMKDYQNGEWTKVEFFPRHQMSDIPPSEFLNAKDLLTKAVTEIGTKNHKIDTPTNNVDYTKGM